MAHSSPLPSISTPNLEWPSNSSLDWSSKFGGNIPSNSNLDWSFFLWVEKKTYTVLKSPHKHVHVELDTTTRVLSPLWPSSGMLSYCPWPRTNQALVKYFQKQEAHYLKCHVPLTNSFNIWKMSLLYQKNFLSLKFPLPYAIYAM